MLYTGITTDIARRMTQHQAGKGAKVLRGKGELTLVFHCQIGDLSMALKLEYRIKQLIKTQKREIGQSATSLIGIFAVGDYNRLNGSEYSTTPLTPLRASSANG